MRIGNLILVLLLTSFLLGCSLPLPFVSYNPFGEQPAEHPRAAIKEIRKYGITLSTTKGHFPSDVLIKTNPGEHPSASVRFQETPDVSVSLLQWYFIPHRDFDKAGEFDFHHRAVKNGYSFSFIFLIEDSGTSTEIPSTNSLPADHENGYLGTARLTKGPDQMVTAGNRVLNQPIVRIPLTATHIEVFMQAPDSPERISISKVALEKLTAWRKYIKPIAESL